MLCAEFPISWMGNGVTVKSREAMETWYDVTLLDKLDLITIPTARKPDVGSNPRLTPSLISALIQARRLDMSQLVQAYANEFLGLPLQPSACHSYI